MFIVDLVLVAGVRKIIALRRFIWLDYQFLQICWLELASAEITKRLFGMMIVII